MERLINSQDKLEGFEDGSAVATGGGEGGICGGDGLE